ncbi:MAG: hypothetical protein ACRDOO_28565 [Actinomadura sp.]
MTGVTPSSRQGVTRRGGLLAGAGWSLLALAVLLSVSIAGVVVLVVLGLLGTACLVVGCHLLARGKANWVYPVAVFGGVAIMAGLGFGAQQLVLELRGTTVTCEVAGVERSVAVGNRAQRVRYVHTVACPGEAFTMTAFPPRSQGDTTEVTFDPRGTVAPRFTDTLPSRARLVPFLAVAAAGGSAVLILPLTAWRRGRRWATMAARPPAPLP